VIVRFWPFHIVVVVLGLCPLLLQTPPASAAVIGQQDVFVADEDRVNYEGEFELVQNGDPVRTVRFEVRPGRRQVLWAGVQNLHETMPDDVSVKGCASGRGFRVRWSDQDGGITRQVKRGTYVVSLASSADFPQSRAGFDGVVRASRRLDRGDEFHCRLSARSSLDDESVDVVRIVVRVR
jgi:hypothetical protein